MPGCRALRSALRAFPVLGIRTNIPFLLRLIDLPDFVEGRLHTGFVDEHMASLTGCTEPDGYVYAAAALAAGAGRAQQPLPRGRLRRRTRGHSRPAGDADGMPAGRITLRVGERDQAVDVVDTPDGTVVRIEGEAFHVTAEGQRIRVDGAPGGMAWVVERWRYPLGLLRRLRLRARTAARWPPANQPP